MGSNELHAMQHVFLNADFRALLDLVDRALWVTAVTAVTAVLGYPLPTASTVTLIPCMTVMSMMTVFLGYPPRKSRHRHAAILLSEAVRRRIAGHSPALRESRGNVWHTTLQGKV